MAAAGFDWVVVDLEHSVTSIERAAELIRAIDYVTRGRAAGASHLQQPYVQND